MGKDKTDNDGKEVVWQVIFTWYSKEKKDKEILGPIPVSARNQRTAILRAVLKNIKELAKADLLTIDVQAEIF